jgi:hypothetical protein
VFGVMTRLSRQSKIAWVCGLLLISSLSGRVVAGCGCLGPLAFWRPAVVGAPLSIGRVALYPIPQAVAPAPAPVVAPPPLTVLTPPPGTLGTTYRKKTRRIPSDKHPRLGMLVVRGLQPGLKVTVWEMEGFSNDQHVWHFETTSPLIPGLAHVYRVAVWDDQDQLVKSSVRTVRLIPGRIVELEY